MRITSSAIVRLYFPLDCRVSGLVAAVLSSRCRVARRGISGGDHQSVAPGTIGEEPGAGVNGERAHATAQGRGGNDHIRKCVLGMQQIVDRQRERRNGQYWAISRYMRRQAAGGKKIATAQWHDVPGGLERSMTGDL
jgi:hypothetical protein